jgi:hypothetical protein
MKHMESVIRKNGIHTRQLQRTSIPGLSHSQIDHVLADAVYIGYNDRLVGLRVGGSMSPHDPCSSINSHVDTRSRQRNFYRIQQHCVG